MHGKQCALGFVHFTLQIRLECTCNAHLRPKPTHLGSKASLGCSFGLENSRIPRIGSNMLLDSSTLAFKSHLNAHTLPFCSPKSLKPLFSVGKPMHRCAFLVHRVLQRSSKVLFLGVQSLPSGAHLLWKTIEFHA